MIEQRLTHRLTDYWNRSRQDRPMPNIKTFNPDVIADLWPNCFLISMQKSPTKNIYTYVYMGDRVKEVFGQDMTGQHVVSTAAFLPAKKILEKLEIVIHTGQPQNVDGQFVDKTSHVIKYRSCILPFGHDKDNISDFLVGLSWASFG